MDAKEPAGSEEVRFEDLDLVYITSFDLGAPIEAEDLKKLLKSFSERYKMVEGIWIPPERAELMPQFVYRKANELGIEDPEKISIEGLMKNKGLWEEINRAHAMFRAIVLIDEIVFDPEYLELGRFVRLKLTDLNVSIKDKEVHLNELKCELYLLLHSAGVAVLTAWIHLNGNFSTDDLIKIERKLYDAECTIKGSFRNIVIRGTLRGFVEQSIMSPLQATVLFKDEYGSYGAVFDALIRGDITGDKINEKLRTPYSPVHRAVCIRKHTCNYKCKTAEEAIERHLRELAGVFGVHGAWRYYREDTPKKVLGENLSPDVDYAIFVAGPTSLFLGSPALDEELISEEDKELEYRSRELFLVQPVEFLSLSDMILKVYNSVYRNMFKEIRERRKRGETVKPSEIAKIRESLMEGLEEYNNVLLFRSDPERSIMEHGKEKLRLSDKVDTLKSLLEELGDMARTLYDEEISRKQTILTAYFGVFGALGSLLLLPQPFNVVVTAAFLLYPIYELLSSLYRRVKG